MAEKQIFKVNPTMSQATIQSFLSKHNSKIIFSSGTYVVKTPYLIYSNTEIELAKNAILKRMAQCYVFQSSMGQKVTKYNGCHDIYIHGGTIICNGNTKPSNIISIIHSKNITISDIVIKNNVGNHAIELNSSYNCTIDNVTFDGNRQVTGCEFREYIQIDSAFKTAMPYYSNAKATCYDGTSCEKIVIKNCKFKGSNIAIGTHTLLANGNKHKNILIDNCTFESDGVLGKYGAFCRLMGMDDVTIKNNKVSNCGRLVEITTPNKFYNVNSTIVETPNSNVSGCNNINILKNIILKVNNTFKCNGIYVKSNYDTIEHTNIIVKDNQMNGATSIF